MKIVVCIGTGGVFYHGLTKMATFCNRRGSDTIVLLVDPDVVEEKNVMRQWGVGVGQDKVTVASKALQDIVEGVVLPYKMKVGNREGMVDMNDLVTPHMKDKDVEYILVVSAPDNHMARVAIHFQCKELAKVSGVPVIEIIGGNDMDCGYAYGSRHYTKKCTGDWTKKHTDILDEALKEEQELAHPMPCGAVPQLGGEQTMEGNCYTAQCIWELAEIMGTTGVWGEKVWFIDEHKRVVVATSVGKK